jgi:hypothetical protein
LFFPIGKNNEPETSFSATTAPPGPTEQQITTAPHEDKTKNPIVKEA